MGDRRLGRERARTVPRRGHRRPGARRVRQRLGLLDRTDALRLIHLPETHRATRSGPDAGWRSTSCCGCRPCWCCASARSSAIRWASATTIDGELVGRVLRGAAVRADRRAAADDRRDRGRPRRPAPDAPAAAGRRRRGQDVGRGRAMLTAVQGGHQAALMAPTEVLAEQHATGRPGTARRRDGARSRATCSAIGRCASSC